MSVPVCDPQTYAWIKSALDESMRRVIDSVAKSESESDFSALAEAAPEMHRIQGSLKMVELDAAGIFAGDIEELCGKVAGAPPEKQMAFVVIIRDALSALGEYLQGIESGNGVSPLTLLARINSVRKLIPKPALDTYDLFNPSMAFGEALAVDTAPMSEAEREKLFYDLRERYRAALVKWLRGSNRQAQLKVMSELLTDLQKVSNLNISRQLWWVAGGFIDVIAKGDITDEVDIKAQFARIDAEINRLLDQGPAAVASAPPDELMRRMLYYIGSHPDADTARIRRIRKETDLQSWFHTAPVRRRAPAKTAEQKLQDKVAAFAAKVDAKSIEARVGDYLQGALDANAVQAMHAALEAIARGASQAKLDVFAELADALQGAVKNLGPAAPRGAEVKVAGAWLLLQDALEGRAIDATWLNNAAQSKQALQQFGAGGAEITDAPSYAAAKLAAAKFLQSALGATKTVLGGAKKRALPDAAVVKLREKLRQVAAIFAMLNYTDTAELARETVAQLRDANTDLKALAAAMSVLAHAAAQLATDANEPLDMVRAALAKLRPEPAEPAELFADPVMPPESLMDALTPPGDAWVPSAALAPSLDDAKLRGIFVAELRRHIQDLHAAREAAPDEADLQRVQTTLHTLSGNCRNLGLDEMALCIAELEQTAPTSPKFGEALALFERAAVQIEQNGAYDSKLAQALLSLHPAQNPGAAQPASKTHFLADAAEDAVEEEDEFTEEIKRVFLSEDDAPPAQPAAELKDASSPVQPDAESDAETDDEIEQIFLSESETILQNLSASLDAWKRDGLNEERLAAVRRDFHTLKGGAAATGHDDISNLSHGIESLLDSYRIDSGDNAPHLLNLLEEMHDGLSAELGFIPQSKPGHVAALQKMLASLLDGAAAEPAPAARKPRKASKPSKAVQPAAPPLPAESSDWTPPDNVFANRELQTREQSAGGQLRIDNRKLAELINASGEMGLIRSRLKDTLDATRNNLDALRSGMKTMREDLRDMELEADAQIRSLPERETNADEEFDPLQLDRYSKLQAKSREINEKLDALAGIERNLDEHAVELGNALMQQFHIGGRLQDGLMSARMAAIGGYLPRLRHLTRETARGLERSAEFTLAGGEIEVDRQVMDAMMSPLEHLIRNALYHGLESPKQRKSRGKPASAQLQLQVAQQGADLLLEFSDDGGGLDTERLAAHAVERGWAASPDKVTRDDLLRVMTARGFSTSPSVEMEAGRGVGMDVVLQATKDLGGSMALASSDENGVTFQFRLPVTLAVTQALLVRVGNGRYAIRARSVERVVRAAREDITQDGDKRMWQHAGGAPIPVVNLAEKLDEIRIHHDAPTSALVLVRMADGLCAFEVDDFEGVRDIVNKPPGAQLASIKGISGVTVLADSSLVLILNPDGLSGERAPPPSDISPSVPARAVSHVLVVDDSQVVRRVMRRDLESAGIKVTTAIDGRDALEKLSEHPVDAALVDIEMPRMNGYELLSALRQQPRFASLPIIFITSRSSEQHRQRAFDLGADEFVTKPYDPDALVAMMQKIARAGGGKTGSVVL